MSWPRSSRISHFLLAKLPLRHEHQGRSSGKLANQQQIRKHRCGTIRAVHAKHCDRIWGAEYRRLANPVCMLRSPTIASSTSLGQLISLQEHHWLGRLRKQFISRPLWSSRRQVLALSPLSPVSIAEKIIIPSLISLSGHIHNAGNDLETCFWDLLPSTNYFKLVR